MSRVKLLKCSIILCVLKKGGKLDNVNVQFTFTFMNLAEALSKATYSAFRLYICIVNCIIILFSSLAQVRRL